MSPTLYDVLGTAPAASPEALQRAYLRARDRLDTTLNPDAQALPERERLQHELEAAWLILSNPEARAEYDATLPPDAFEAPEPDPTLLLEPAPRTRPLIDARYGTAFALAGMIGLILFGWGGCQAWQVHRYQGAAEEANARAQAQREATIRAMEAQERGDGYTRPPRDGAAEVSREHAEALRESDDRAYENAAVRERAELDERARQDAAERARAEAESASQQRAAEAQERLEREKAALQQLEEENRGRR